MPQLPPEKIIGADHLHAIGLVITQWAGVEALVEAATIRISNANHVAGMIVITGMQFSTMLGILETLVQWHVEQNHSDNSEQLSKEFTKIAKKLRKSYDDRNIYAHNIAGPGSKPNHIRFYGLKTVGRIKTLEGEVTPHDIRRVAEKMNERGIWLKNFFSRIGVDVHAISDGAEQ